MASFRSGATLRGAANMARQFQLLNDRMKKMSPDAVYEYGKMVVEDAKALTPVDTGALRDSGFVDQPVQSTNGRYVTVELGFGKEDPTAGYALIQHENEDYAHRIGQAHYLLDALQSSVSAGRRFILGRLASVLGK